MTTLRIALRNYADFENALQEEAHLFEALNAGVRVELVPLGIRELHQQAIEKGGLASGHFDLALLVTDWLAECTAAKAIEDLQPWHNNRPIAQWPTGWSPTLVRPLLSGKFLSALPWHDGPECLVYRKDLFSDPNRRLAFRTQYHRDLEPPSTWAEFEQVARFFTNPEEKLYGTAVAAVPDGHNTLYDFVLQTWTRGGDLTDLDGRPILTSEAATQGLDFYRTMVRNPAICHPRSTAVDSTQSGDLFLAGEVAMMANWFGFAARACRPGSGLSGKVDIAPLPVEHGCDPTSLSVFWALVMASGSRHKSLAWDFLRFVTAPEQDLGVTRHGAVGARLSTWRNPALREEIPVYSQLERISMRSRTLPSCPAMATFASIVDRVMTRALHSVDPTIAILEEAQQQVDSAQLRLV